MAGIEGDNRPGKNEAAFKSGNPGSGERENQRTHQSAESRILSVVNTVQRREGEPVDPYRISYTLMDYQDKVYATRTGAIVVPKPGWEYQTVKQTRELTEEDDAFIDTISRVRDAFDIAAFSRFPPNYQKALSYEVYQEIEDVADEDKADYPRSPDKSITLNEPEKNILSRLLTLASIPDNPQQHTYSYGSIPHIVDAKYKY